MLWGPELEGCPRSLVCNCGSCFLASACSGGVDVFACPHFVVVVSAVNEPPTTSFDALLCRGRGGERVNHG